MFGRNNIRNINCDSHMRAGFCFVPRQGLIITRNEWYAMAIGYVNSAWYGYALPVYPGSENDLMRALKKNKYLAALISSGNVVRVPRFWIPADEKAFTDLYEYGMVIPPRWDTTTPEGMFPLENRIEDIISDCRLTALAFPSDAIRGDILRDLAALSWDIAVAWETVRPISYLRYSQLSEDELNLCHSAYRECASRVYQYGMKAYALKEKLNTATAASDGSQEGEIRLAIEETLTKMRELRTHDPDAISSVLLETYTESLTR